ncbi:MAG: Rha family transcriptional regulator [Defluviitaleaceae bacterium]|nr:Rha family transcriptional regulator [Defluviitaleaceae bacterium]
MKNELVVLKKGKMIVTSLELVEQINLFREEAENKTKMRHDTLLGIIRDEFSEEIAAQEILGGYYKDKQNQKRPMFELTTSQAKQVLLRESKIVRKALIARIEYFEDNIREKFSANWQTARITGKEAHQKETDTIRDKLIPLAIQQGSTNYSKLYLTYAKLINSMLKINSDMRDYLPYRYLMAIDMLEHMIENVIAAEVEKGTHYKEIFQICKAKCQIAVDLSFLPKLELLS